MFKFLKELFQHPKARSPKDVKLMPESLVRVQLNENEIVTEHPDGKVERVAIADLRAIIIQTLDVPTGCTDVYYMLIAGTPGAGCTFPLGATGDSDFLKWAEKLPGFDKKAFDRAISSTHEEGFWLWKSPAPSNSGMQPTCQEQPAADAGR